MTGAGMGAPSVISRMRELSGQRPALELADEEPLTGRPLTVNVVAEDGREGRPVRATIIEFGLMDTGQWMIRYRYLSRAVRTPMVHAATGPRSRRAGAPQRQSARRRRLRPCATSP